MVKRKVSPWIIIIIVLVGLYFLPQINFKGFSITEIINSGTVNNYYECESSGENSFCDVQGRIECNTTSGTQPLVDFRGTYDYNTNGAIVGFKAPGQTGMSSYVHNERESSAKCGDDRSELLYIVTNPNAQIRLYNGNLLTCSQSGNNLEAWTWELGGNANTDPSLQQGEVCNQGRIHCAGEGIVYQCQGEFTAGTYTEIMDCASAEPCTDTSATKTLTPGQTATISGGDENTIDFEEYVVIETCNIDVCTDDKQGIIRCVNERPADIPDPCDIDAGEVCKDSPTGAYCVPPFELGSLVFRNADNTQTVQAYTTDEAVNIRFLVQSPSVNTPVPTTIRIKKGDEIKYEENIQYTPNAYRFEALSSIILPGTYTVELELNYLGSKIKFGGFSFIITSTPIQVSLDMSTKLIDDETGGEYNSYNEFYTNHPIKLEMHVYESGNTDNKVTFDSYDVKAYLNGNQIQLPEPTISLGLAKYNLILQNSGNLVIEGTATKSGLESDLVSIDNHVDTPSVEVIYLNDKNLKSLEPGTTADVEFETRSSIGNLLSTTNDIRVLETGGTEQTIGNIFGSNGEYYFPFTFGNSGDQQKAYQFFIVSSALNHLSSVETQSALISVSPGNQGEVECVSDSQCNDGYECVNEECKAKDLPFSPMLYLVIGIVAVLILIIIIAFVRRKRSPSFKTFK